MGLTAAHWVYLAGVVLIVGVTIARKNVIVPALVATAVTAWVMTGSPIRGIQAIFDASLTAASELFNIFLIIAMVTALLGVLRAMKADQRMVTPFRTVMRGGWSAFVVLAVVGYGISLFFWPTPAVPLIGAILVPAAIRAGLPAMGAAMAIAIAGQGMALSSDYVMQVAPGLSAKAAGTTGSAVADAALVLSLITGVVALVITAVLLRRHLKQPSAVHLEQWEAGVVAELTPARRWLRRVKVTARQEPAEEEEKVAVGVTAGPPGDDRPRTRGGGGHHGNDGPPAFPEDPGSPAIEIDSPRVVRLSKVFAAVVPLAFLLMIVYMALGKFTNLVPSIEGGSAAALVGGLAAVIVVVAAMALDGPKKALTSVGGHVTDGLVFAFRAMGVVLPIAGFFFLGNADFAGKILGYEDGTPAPGLLVDLVTAAARHIPHSGVIVCFGMLVIGMACGLEGSGFSGLPLTGSLAGALGPTVGVSPSALAAVGQMGSIWAGGGVLVAWSSLLVVAGVTRVPVIDLARKCFFPVVAGLVASTIFAALVL
ncbi:hypothetical protein FPZ12_043510 [Amycolatopsis acidicola]|uniref:Permease n=1 Tax=Amycolatopsis acidicola TaxID=2596893 RepID=A0A5N0UMP5_9PSEU|nr:hypothetical protein [Amycolatopsis acidicola]KAA9149311.1 hypothetical protein FPZ12_043510 [Amycolatopsis acidicola]